MLHLSGLGIREKQKNFQDSLKNEGLRVVGSWSIMARSKNHLKWKFDIYFRNYRIDKLALTTSIVGNSVL